MNKQLLIKIVSTSVIFLLLGFSLRYLLNNSLLITDLSGIGILVSFLGTIYTLIAAFTIVEVWGQFNNVSNLLSKEAKALTSIWNYVDYLNDAKLDKNMKNALTSYIQATIANEHADAAKGIRSLHPSDQLLGIFHVLDSVSFNDKRDAAVFPLLVTAYEELSSIRSERIDASVTRLPSLLKFFFYTLTVLLMIGFIIIGFNNLAIFIFAVIAASFITSVTYQIIFDLDNPFDGEWNIEYTPFEQSLEYISKTKHTIAQS